MKQGLILACALALFSCSTTKFYIVRHAEKEVASEGTTMSTPGDPALSSAGRVRAEVLKEELKDADVRHIFTTKTSRTLGTAEPLHELHGLRMNLYNHRDTLDRFIARLRSIKNGNVLIVGHSNTVDDIANALAGKTVIPGDLSETEYDNLFIVTKKGTKYLFEKRDYGAKTE